MENLQKRSNWVDDVLHAITINFQVKISGRSGWAAQHEQQKKLQVKEGGTFFPNGSGHISAAFGVAEQHQPLTTITACGLPPPTTNLHFFIKKQFLIF